MQTQDKEMLSLLDEVDITIRNSENTSLDEKYIEDLYHDKGQWKNPIDALSKRFHLEEHLIENKATSENTFMLNISEHEITRFGFHSAGINFLIGVDIVCQTIEIPTVYRLPNLGKWIPGVINLKGNFIPVIDLDCFLNSDKPSTRDDNLFIIGQGEDAAALIIKGYPSNESLSNKVLLPKPPGIPKKIEPFVKDAFSNNDEIWLDLDLDYFLSEVTQSAVTV